MRRFLEIVLFILALICVLWLPVIIMTLCFIQNKIIIGVLVGAADILLLLCLGSDGGRL